jgi:hypothetical protein
MNVDGKDYAEGIGWYDINEAYCINGCGKPAVGESEMVYLPAGDFDFNVIVELLCIDCITDVSQITV